MDEQDQHESQSRGQDGDDPGDGVCLKIEGERDKALESFRKARNLDPHGEVGRQANEQIEKLSRDDE